MITVKSKVNNIELQVPSQQTAKQYGQANDGVVFQRMAGTTKAFTGIDIVDGKIVREQGDTGLPDTDQLADEKELLGLDVSNQQEPDSIAKAREMLRAKSGQKTPAQVG